ncbi:hypothetical protein WJX74_001105 [Apatococcus lobatus]|uniref:Macro domain-containing protein n=1 Tax=Apatococcus lobatus TaxID=904363 RepID=A0AAW1RIQ8_9CHLO
MSEKKPDVKPFKLANNTKLMLAMGDLTQFQGDAVVNAANEAGIGGGGVDGAIHRAAGPVLKKFCTLMPTVRGDDSVRIPTGKAIATRGFELDADIIIHTVGPIYKNDKDSAPLLASAYRSSLDVAEFYEIRRLAFPAISCGIFGYPHGKAARIALDECQKGAQRTAFLNEIWFAFFEKAVFSAFLDAADEMLQPFEVGPADSTDASPASSAAPAEPTPAAAQDVNMAESSAQAASAPASADMAGRAMSLDESAPSATQPDPHQARPAAGSLQEQVKAAMTAQHLAGSSPGPSPASNMPMALGQTSMEVGHSLSPSLNEPMGSQAGLPTETARAPGSSSSPLGTGMITSQEDLVSCPGPDASQAVQDPHTAPAGGVPKGTLAGLMHGQTAQEGTSPLGRVTGGSATAPPAGAERMGGSGELESLGAKDTSPARSSAAAALSSAQGFPGHVSPLAKTSQTSTGVRLGLVAGYLLISLQSFAQQQLPEPLPGSQNLPLRGCVLNYWHHLETCRVL